MFNVVFFLLNIIVVLNSKQPGLYGLNHSNNIQYNLIYDISLGININFSHKVNKFPIMPMGVRNRLWH